MLKNPLSTSFPYYNTLYNSVNAKDHVAKHHMVLTKDHVIVANNHSGFWPWHRGC